MKKARVRVNGLLAGILEKINESKFIFIYDEGYKGSPVSLTMPIKNKTF